MAITNRPAPTRYDRDAWAQALEAYDAINRSLKARPVRPGYVEAHGRILIRGEFENVPKRYLDLSDRRIGYGDVDDRAHEFEPLGIYDGDDLVAWMQDAKRPLLADYVIHESAIPKGTVAERMKAMRARKAALGLCASCCQRKPDRGRYCYLCNARSMERMARKREAEKEARARKKARYARKTLTQPTF